MRSQIQQVLANWLEQARSPIGTLSSGVSAENWVAEQFWNWWTHGIASGEILGDLDDAESACENVKRLLADRGGFDKYGEEMHELSHLADSLASLRRTLVQQPHDPEE